ncbi:MAG: DedA family protein [Campylobacterota bacterium]
MGFIKRHSGKLVASAVLVLALILAYNLYQAPVEGLDKKFIYLLKEYGYVILFAWSILEGELGLIMAGLLAHNGNMLVPVAIFVAGLGAFTGDQINFYIGRYNKGYVLSKLKSQRRKFALAHLLLKRYGWPIIFVQRYLFGMRTVIPISIGLTRYDAKKFAIVNLISAWCWAAITILPTWYFGKEIMEILHWAKAHWYLAVPFALLFVGSVMYYFHVATKKVEKKVVKEYE